MKVCFFGSYDPDYSRNRILLAGLRQNRVIVIHCLSKYGFFIPRYYELIRKFMTISGQVDIIFVAYRGHLDILLVWVIGKLFRKKVVFDIYYSLYDNYLNDRKSVKPGSLAAAFYFWLDKINCALADKVIVYTKEAGKFLEQKFKVKKAKLVLLYVGGNDALYKPVKKRARKKVFVEFHGWFTRMQGAEYFIKAAKRLEQEKNIEFWLIGNTVNYQKPLKLLRLLRPKTLLYFDTMPETKLAQKIAQADIAVGHLGTTQKADITISNKMFQALASKLALICGDYMATGELLTDKKNCLKIAPGDDKDLAQKIMTLVKDDTLRRRIAYQGHRLHQRHLTNYIIGKRLKEILLN